MFTKTRIAIATIVAASSLGSAVLPAGALADRVYKETIEIPSWSFGATSSTSYTGGVRVSTADLDGGGSSSARTYTGSTTVNAGTLR